jgi:2',3'-cyclic-nucleotide 2'-phosphodiesterase
LFIGDIVGRIGRKAVAKILPKLKRDKAIDLVIANAENSAHGAGITEEIINELRDIGVDVFTTGDHAFDNRKNLEIFDKFDIIRPANFSPRAPGRGYLIFSVKGKNVLVINLIGRVFMSLDHECPFRELDEILANSDLPIKKISAIIIDIHAETTAEKINLGYYAAGRASAVLGTHTHIMTADAKILSGGTAYITDTGMAGAADESLGIGKAGTLEAFLTQIKQPHVIPERGLAIFNAVLIDVNTKTARARSIKPITQFINIK